MKTEFERISEIMYTLLEHQPVIDVPYEKINDIAIALVKEGYGKVSEYETEREMLGSQIKVLKQRLNDKYIEVDNLNRDYRNAFERLKAQEREIERLKENLKNLKDDFESLQKDYEFVRDCDAEHCLEIEETVKQAKIDVLNEAKEQSVHCDQWNCKVVPIEYIDQMIEELKK